MRTLLTVPMTLRHLNAAGVGKSRGITLDISEGGIGALVQGNLHVGETVEIDLRFPQHPLSTFALVRHTSSARSGFEFRGLTPEQRKQIADVAASC